MIMLQMMKEYWTPLTADVTFSLGTMILGLVIYRTLRRGLRTWTARGRLSAGITTLLVPMIRWSIVTATVLVMLQRFGVLQTAWTAITGVLALVAIGLVAVWSVLSNAMCTILLLVFKPFRMGDCVSLPTLDIQGTSVDINFVYTTLLEENGSLVRIPNNTFFQSAVRIIPGKQATELSEQLDRRMTDEELLRVRERM